MRAEDATAETGGRAKMPRLDSAIARLPTDFLVLASLFFALGVIALPIVGTEATRFFYQPLILALVHTFTLGFITSTIIGVMYRYVPALTRTAIRYPRLALAQLALYALGVIGMVAHFAVGVWSGTWMSAVLVAISVALFALNMFVCLWPRIGRAAAETGMFLAIVFLLSAAVVGTLLAMDKVYGFLGGSLVTNLGGHVALAGIGWITLTICAVSYRFIPAFILPKIALPRMAAWQLYLLAIGVIGLALSLFFNFPGVILFSALIALSLAAYLLTLIRLMRTRRRPIGWPLRHSIAGAAWLVAAIALGLVLAQTGGGTAAGNRIAGAWAAAGLLGWIANFIIGMSYELFPGFVSKARTALGWPAIRAQELSSAAAWPIVFVIYNLGVLVLTAGLLLKMPVALRAGGSLVSAGGLIYAAITLAALSYAYRSAVPRRAPARAT